MKKVVYLITLSALILLAIPYSLSDINAESNTYHANDYTTHQTSSKVALGQAKITKEQQELTNKQVKQVLNQFMNHLIQETNDQYQVVNYQSLEEYKSSFKGMANSKVVDFYVDEIYYEKGQALYLKGMDLPPWFEEEQEFSKESLDHNTYRITQTNQSDLYGNYRIIVDLKLNEDGEPYIINVQYQ
ncbi:hypothetical protein [Piscibacillus salipiscarius]|uniref:Uncharacterized protein n=1 Tax=Piscibacillus salipiscarius TaxID=299480 RepID=A0ABW5QCR6_9BACI|nr:hypothetical protein [Piscibacillus salipiscarius]